MNSQGITVRPVDLASGEDGLRLRAMFVDSDGEHPFFVDLAGVTAAPDAMAVGNALLCFALVPAMARGLDLHVDAPVSRLLLHRSVTICDIFSRWYPRWERRIAATAADTVEQEPEQRQPVASFFTGGVDSLFTLKERDPDALVYVQGFELVDGDTRSIDPARESAATAAQMTGKRFIEVTSDVRSYLDRYTNWLTETNAAALAAVGHLLSGEFGAAVISSSNSYERLSPLGCDPLLDPLWGSASMEVEEFGSHACRPQKVEAIAGWEVAKATLRVCGSPDFETANCGRCEKCVRTWAGLFALGEDEAYRGRYARVPTLQDISNLDISLSRRTSWFDWEALEEYLAGRELDEGRAELLKIVRERLLWRSRRILNQKIRGHAGEVVASEPFRERWPKFRRKVLRSIEETDPDWLVDRVRKSLPDLREALYAQLANDPVWLKKKLRRARWRRLRERLHLAERPN